MGDLTSPIYEAFDAKSLQIRLLYLEPCVGDDQVLTCRMSVASLSKDLQYHALSYVWGDLAPTDLMILDGSPFRITYNLAVALKHLRTTELFVDETALPIWIDAICINQEDLAERSQQLAIMGSIYSGARCILSWLGEPDRSGRYMAYPWLGEGEEVPMTHGFPIIRAVSRYIDSRREDATKGWDGDSILTEEDFQWIAKNPDFYRSDVERLVSNQRWNAIVSIDRATYWTRIWIVQEIVLASSPHQHLFFCGAEYVTYHQLDDLHGFLQKVHDQRPARPSFMPGLLWSILSERDFMDFTIMHMIQYLRHRISGSSATMVPYVARQCSCTDPRDTVYGLLAVVENSIVPDYSKPVAQVYQDWFADSLERGRLEDIMAWSGIGHGFPNSHGIPSWIPVLHELSKEGFQSVILRGGNRDWNENLWLEILQPEPPRIIGDGLFSIHGVLLDTISEVHFPWREEPTSQERFARFCKDLSTRYNGRRYKTGLLLLEAVFAVLFEGDDYITNQKLVLPLEPTNRLALAFRHFLMPEKSDTSQEAEDLRHTIDRNLFDVEDKETKKSWIEAFDSAVDSHEVLYGLRALSNRTDLFTKNSFFLTQRGYLGTGPPHIYAGDRICLLQGATLPSLLRKVESHWAYVGTCYVQGLSQGEPLQMIKANEVQVEELTLR